MSRSRNSYLPPITQVIENARHQRSYREGSSLVIIWVDFIHPNTGSSASRTRRPQTPLSRLMKTVDLRGAEPAQEGVEHFSFVVCFPDDVADNTDSQAMYAERRPVTSRGFRSTSEEHTGLNSNDFIKNKFLMFTKRAQKFVPTTMADSLLRRRV